MSISARARTLTSSELIRLYEVSSEAERRELAEALYVRLRFHVDTGYSASSFIPVLHN